MTNEEKEMIRVYREAGVGYSTIAKEMGISINTIKTFCKRNDLGGNRYSPIKKEIEYSPCDNCRRPVLQTKGRKHKRFCSDSCRNTWWNTHQYLINKKTINEYTCLSCGSLFKSYGNTARKYCCHACYIKGRYKGVRYEFN